MSHGFFILPAPNLSPSPCPTPLDFSLDQGIQDWQALGKFGEDDLLGPTGGLLRTPASTPPAARLEPTWVL